MAANNTIPPTLTENDILRFRSKIDRTPGHGPKGECWLWTGTLAEKKRANGYGRFGAGRRFLSPHRVALFLATGVWAGELHVCHSCDVSLCCNPEHLFAGTQQDNIDDATAKGHRGSGEGNGAYTHPERRPSGDRNGMRLHPESVPRGEKNGRTLVTEADVREMRSLRESGFKLAEITERFSYTGISLEGVWRIVARKNWRHVQ